MVTYYIVQIDVQVKSPRCHSAKVLSPSVCISMVAMVTGLWRHLTYNSRGAWHTVYAMLLSNFK